MNRDALLDEQSQLLTAQRKALESEVFGGLSAAEQAEYDTRRQRLRELVTELARE